MPGIPERKNRPNTPSLSEPSLLFLRRLAYLAVPLSPTLQRWPLCHFERKSVVSGVESIEKSPVVSVTLAALHRRHD